MKALSPMLLKSLYLSGWSIERKTPLTIQHEDGSRVSGAAISLIIDNLSIIGSDVLIYNASLFKSANEAKKNNALYNTKVKIKMNSSVSELLDIVQDISKATCDIFNSKTNLVACVQLNNKLFHLKELIQHTNDTLDY